MRYDSSFYSVFSLDHVFVEYRYKRSLFKNAKLWACTGTTTLVETPP